MLRDGCPPEILQSRVVEGSLGRPHRNRPHRNRVFDSRLAGGLEAVDGVFGMQPGEVSVFVAQVHVAKDDRSHNY